MRMRLIFLLFLLAVHKCYADLDETIQIGKGFLDVGGFAFEKIAGKLSLVGATASLIKDIINSGKPDPVMQRLNELGDQIGELSNHMDWQFKKLEAFQVENDFYRDISSTSKMLHMYLKDLIKNPNQHSLGLFRDATLRHPPLQCAYKFIALFENDPTNPMIAAMNADRFHTIETHDKWRKITGDVLGSFLYLETMVNGLFWDRNMYGPNELEGKIYGIYGRLDWLRDHYRKTYWDGDKARGESSPVRNLIESVQEDKSLKTNDDKALKIKEGLMAMLTEDHVFYIIVYDDVYNCDNHAFSYNKDQYMESFHRHGTNIVVYRSYHWKEADQNAMDTFKRNVEGLKLHARPDYDYHMDFMRKLVPDSGMVGVIRKDHHVAIRSANSQKAEWGPGWWVTGTFETNMFEKNIKWIMIGGYK